MMKKKKNEKKKMELRTDFAIIISDVVHDACPVKIIQTSYI